MTITKPELSFNTSSHTSSVSTAFVHKNNHEEACKFQIQNEEIELVNEYKHLDFTARIRKSRKKVSQRAMKKKI